MHDRDIYGPSSAHCKSSPDKKEAQIRKEKEPGTVPVAVIKKHSRLSREYASPCLLGKCESVCRCIPAKEKRAVMMTCDRWIKTSEQRTQILYRADVSLILYHMSLKAGYVLVESGTGTLSLTFSLSKAVGDSGQVRTVECNEQRYCAALKDIKQADLKNVTAYNCRVEDYLKTVPDLVDGIVLDVPEPDLVIFPALDRLRPLAVLCCFVPCIEQAQRVIFQVREYNKKGAPGKKTENQDAEESAQGSRARIDRMVENVEVPHKPVRLAEDRFGTAPLPVIRGHTGYLLVIRRL